MLTNNETNTLVSILLTLHILDSKVNKVDCQDSADGPLFIVFCTTAELPTVPKKLHTALSRVSIVRSIETSSTRNFSDRLDVIYTVNLFQRCVPCNIKFIVTKL